MVVIFFLLFEFFPGVVMGYDNVRVHPYLAAEAAKVWPNDSTHEISTYMGQWHEYVDCGSNFLFCPNEMCILSWTGGLITEGANEEDYYDSVTGLCALQENVFPPGMGFHHHFMDPTEGGPNNGLCGDVGALSYAQIYWLEIIKNYPDPATRGVAYWYLGKIAHLLADMAVPAHVHRDPHTPWNDDSYEKYTLKNFTRWTARQASLQPPLPLGLNLEGIFNYMANTTIYYPSDDKVGASATLFMLSDPNCWSSLGSICEVDIVNSDCDISADNLQVIGDALVPTALQSIAALYQFFWREFHIGIEGPESVSVLNKASFSASGKWNGRVVDL